jgi:hypothetical protein
VREACARGLASYHGAKAALAEGDLIGPGYASNNASASRPSLFTSLRRSMRRSGARSLREARLAVLDFVFRQIRAQGFVEALDEALGIVIDEIVEIGFEIGLEHVFAVLGEDEA